jgi:transposase
MGKMQTALGPFYRHLAARVGKAKVVTATARKLAVFLDNTLRYSIAYQGPRAAYYEERYRQRVLTGLRAGGSSVTARIRLLPGTLPLPPQHA